jgi:hypothetical protein
MSWFVLAHAPAEWNRLLQADVIVPLGGCVIGLAAVIGHYWLNGVRARENAELKRAMIERGMTPEDIERVIHAGTKSESS